MSLIIFQRKVTPKLGLKSIGKRFILPEYGLIFNKILGPRCRLLQLSYIPSFPTCLSHPKKCSPSVSPLPFWGFNNMLNKKYESPVSNSQCTREKFPVNSHWKRVLMGLTNHLFDSKQDFPRTRLIKMIISYNKIHIPS
jgi:hypothetical protein